MSASSVTAFTPAELQKSEAGDAVHDKLVRPRILSPKTMILELGGQTRHSGHIHCMSIGGLPFQVLRLSAERHYSECQKGVAEQASW